jgi:hypothetical protein
MSVGESFTLVPLSNFFVKKAAIPGPETNLGSIHPIASGRIENDAVNISGGVTGNYAWYRISHYEGATGTQGKEVREYFVVFRGVSATASSSSFHLPIPDGGFDTTYEVYKLLYTSMRAKTPGSGSHDWNANIVSQGTHLEIITTTTFNPNNESFFFYVMGI